MREILKIKENGTGIIHHNYNITIKNKGKIEIIDYLNETDLEILKMEIELENKGIDIEFINKFKELIKEQQTDYDYYNM